MNIHKDLERCFGVLQVQWAIIRNPSHYWEIETIKDILMAFVMMHNMILENKSSLGLKNMFGEGGVIGV
jgi:hypothetical protein